MQKALYLGLYDKNNKVSAYKSSFTMIGGTRPTENVDDRATYTFNNVKSGWNAVATKNDPNKLNKVVYDMQQDTVFKSFSLFAFAEYNTTYMKTYKIYKYSGESKVPTSGDAGWEMVKEGTANTSQSY